METIVRIKRKVDESPLAELLLDVKRRKSNPDGEEQSPSKLMVFQFVGTSNKTEDITKCIKKHNTKANIEKNYKKRYNSRRQGMDLSGTQRFKVVNLLITYAQSEPSDTEDEGFQCVILDTERLQDSPGAGEKEKEEKMDCEYDLYYSNADIEVVDDLENAELHGCFTLIPECVDYDSDEYDSEDSNCENNPRNFYPSESEEDDDPLYGSEMCYSSDSSEVENLDTERSRTRVEEIRQKYFDYLSKNDINYEDWIK